MAPRKASLRQLESCSTPAASTRLRVFDAPTVDEEAQTSMDTPVVYSWTQVLVSRMLLTVAADFLRTSKPAEESSIIWARASSGPSRRTWRWRGRGSARPNARPRRSQQIACASWPTLFGARCTISGSRRPAPRARWALIQCAVRKFDGNVESALEQQDRRSNTGIAPAVVVSGTLALAFEKHLESEGEPFELLEVWMILHTSDKRQSYEAPACVLKRSREADTNDTVGLETGLALPDPAPATPPGKRAATVDATVRKRLSQTEASETSLIESSLISRTDSSGDTVAGSSLSQGVTCLASRSESHTCFTRKTTRLRIRCCRD